MVVDGENDRRHEHEHPGHENRVEGGHHPARDERGEARRRRSRCETPPALKELVHARAQNSRQRRKAKRGELSVPGAKIYAVRQRHQGRAERGRTEPGPEVAAQQQPGGEKTHRSEGRAGQFHRQELVEAERAVDRIEGAIEKISVVVPEDVLLRIEEDRIAPVIPAAKDPEPMLEAGRLNQRIFGVSGEVEGDSEKVRAIEQQQRKETGDDGQENLQRQRQFMISFRRNNLGAHRPPLSNSIRNNDDKMLFDPEIDRASLQANC